MYVPAGVAGAVDGVRPRSLRCVGVSGISVISSTGAQNDCRDLQAPKRSRRRIAAKMRDSRAVGTGEIDLVEFVSLTRTK
jgi:hypothetical protein